MVSSASQSLADIEDRVSMPGAFRVRPTKTADFSLEYLPTRTRGWWSYWTSRAQTTWLSKFIHPFFFPPRTSLGPHAYLHVPPQFSPNYFNLGFQRLRENPICPRGRVVRVKGRGNG